MEKVFRFQDCQLKFLDDVIKINYTDANGEQLGFGYNIKQDELVGTKIVESVNGHNLVLFTRITGLNEIEIPLYKHNEHTPFESKEANKKLMSDLLGFAFEPIESFEPKKILKVMSVKQDKESGESEEGTV